MRLNEAAGIVVGTAIGIACSFAGSGIFLAAGAGYVAVNLRNTKEDAARSARETKEILEKTATEVSRAATAIFEMKKLCKGLFICIGGAAAGVSSFFIAHSLSAKDEYYGVAKTVAAICGITCIGAMIAGFSIMASA
jgi:hypothetical protein